MLPQHVVVLFRELGGVLEEARRRLDALLAAVPTQDAPARQADADAVGR